MLDILLIQHVQMGINLLEYRQAHTKFNRGHSAIFSGFLNAIQSVISNELDIGTVVLISTMGEKGHNCIIVPKSVINIIILCDLEDPIELWRMFGEDIAEKFLDMFGTNRDFNNISQFENFKDIIKDMCMDNKYCL